jgi:3D (Asp-Asp-Asp) domain-containing protein/uncharacterized protein YabE (DUF348 family)
MSRKKKYRSIWPAAIGAAALSLCLTVALGSQKTCTYTITDGTDTTVHTSAAEDIDTVLQEAGIILGENDLVSATGGSTRGQIVIQRSQDVAIQYGGDHLSASTYGSTVGELLEQLNLDLGPGDTVTSEGAPLSIDAETYDGMSLEITRTTTETQTASVSVPYETVTYLDPSLEEGTTVVETVGQEGTNQLTLCLTYVNGELTDTSVTATRVVSAPVNEVVLVGSKATCTESEDAVAVYEEPEEEEAETEPVTETSAETSTETVKETASEPVSTSTSVSAPEPEPEPEPETETVTSSYSSSSGNTITTSSGTVLSYSKVLSMTATAYTGGGTTATGTQARYGAIAVDPSVIPYGTKLYIVTEDGSWVYGEATAEDCGGAIKGNIIDLYFDSYSTCIQFGRRACTVYVLD